ncbi:ethanolamine kinase [Scheffersomyces xylosifermentans]|uniref:ethanolamine kinase n=1 Tax=Scheffersomyces xylosifermentans TaxID=1304137 RepID=UPI00315C6014
MALDSSETNPHNPSSSAYCFISNKDVHCIPINSFNSFSDSFLALDNTSRENDDADFTPDKMYLKNRNLLYSLNNPSLSDIELDASPIPAHAVLNGVSNSPTGNNHSNNGNHHSFNHTNTLCVPPSTSDLDFSSIIHNYTTHAIYLPNLIINLSENLSNDFLELKALLVKIFPTWTNKNNITLKQLTGGITNMLLRCTCTDTNETVLIRVYGHGTNLIIDRHREFISHLILNSIGLAPPIHSRFKNGLIYGFLSGRSLEPNELRNPNLFPLIAQQLGNWHEKLDYRLIQNGVEKLRTFSMNLKKAKKENGKENGKDKDSSSNNGTKRKSKKKKFISNIWELIEDWISIVPVNPDLISSFNSNLKNVEVTEDNLKSIINEEFAWLKENLNKSSSPVVSSHCDLLSGNVIIPDNYDLDKPFTGLPSIDENPIKFIDYEYMLPAPRAFDIANHLAEWQGFECDTSAIPTPHISNPVLVKWVKGYLGDENADIEKVGSLIEEIATFYGLPGFYWGIWAMIQSELSNIDFNYSNYGKLRLEEYWVWKGHYLKKQKAAT